MNSMNEEKWKNEEEKKKNRNTETAHRSSLDQTFKHVFSKVTYFQNE